MSSLILKNIPEDVRAHVLEIQVKIKVEKNTQFSQESTIYKIIREHKELKDKKR